LSAPATEESPYGFLGELPYHHSKREGERAALALGGGGLEVVVTNPSFAVGARDVRPTSGELLLAIARGWMLAYPTGGTSVANAEDVAEGMVLAMDRGVPGERYLLGGENLTFRELFTQCAEECGRPAPLFPLPRQATDALALASDLAGTLVRALGPLASDTLRRLSRPSYVSSERAIQRLGYRPRRARFGIREAYRWFQEEGLLPRDRPLSPEGPLGLVF
jgi:dihydroflavonol-4-reductase